MEFMLDTINLKEIETYAKIIPLAGVTSNPSIIKKEGKIDFFNHMKTIKEIIGDASLHVQVVGIDYDGIIIDAARILDEIAPDAYIKIPVNEAGLQAIKYLKQQNVNVTATAIYTEMQAYLAIAAGADYIAPYYNRMENLNIASKDVIYELRKQIDFSKSETKILAASFKNVAQVNTAYQQGAHAATMGVDILQQVFANPSIDKAVNDFSQDFQSTFGANKTIIDL